MHSLHTFAPYTCCSSRLLISFRTSQPLLFKLFTFTSRTVCMLYSGAIFPSSNGRLIDTREDSARKTSERGGIYCEPAEWSCHRARHCACTVRGQEQGWINGRDEEASSRQTQHTAFSLCKLEYSADATKSVWYSAAC